MNYLDTSIIRSFSGRPSLINGSENYTSILTIFELLDGNLDSQEDFSRRRNALQTLHDSRIKIVHDHPDVMRFKAFDKLSNSYEIKGDFTEIVQNLAETMLRHESLSSYRSTPQQSDSWNKYRQIYAKLSRSTINNATHLRFQIKNGFTKLSSRDASAIGIINSENPQKNLRNFINSATNKSLSIYSIALHMSELVGMGGDLKFQEEVYSSYNRSIDPYICALSYYLLDRMDKGEPPGENDAIDLEHFVYLGNTSNLITNDKRMAYLASTVGIPSKNSDDFLAEIPCSQSPNKPFKPDCLRQPV